MLVHHPEEQRITLRPAETVCSVDDLGGARSTRHSFARQLVRVMAGDRWQVRRRLFDLDGDGRGTAVYEVLTPQLTVTLVLFSEVIDDAARTDRVVAQSWDVTAALLEGEVTATTIDDLRPQVTRQEEGRALPGTLIWGRANRSQRFFEQVVSALAQGNQPDRDAFGLSPYLLRSTAFYSNGKFGMRDFEGFDDEHALAVPYRSHMLAAWLFREFSYDLAEHCAAERNPGAARLEGAWRRYFGLGNATGLGLVPYVVNHPEILNVWLWSREYPLAAAMARTDAPASAATSLVVELLDHFAEYLQEQGTEEPAPFASGAELAAALRPIRGLAAEYLAGGTMNGSPPDRPWRTLHDAAEQAGPEIRGIVATVVTELTDALDAEVQSSLRCVEERDIDSSMTVEELRALLERHYAWTDRFDFDEGAQSDRFWFTSLDNEEPRRGRTGSDPGMEMQHAVAVAQDMWRLRRGLESRAGTMPVGEFLFDAPWHRASVARVQNVGPLRYGELRVNLRASSFLPLHPQRLQLAVYGMENYNPQSTDWLRVTLFSGAPRAEDLDRGTADDRRMFPLRPGSETGS